MPLKVATVSGFAVSGVAFLLVLYTLYARFVTHDYQPGWASLMVSILFLGGVQLIAVGIIGEYLSRLSTNVRQRPLYIISDTNIPVEAAAQTGAARAPFKRLAVGNPGWRGSRYPGCLTTNSEAAFSEAAFYLVAPPALPESFPGT